MTRSMQLPAVCVLLAAFACASCSEQNSNATSGQQSPSDTDRTVVLTSFYPLTYFAERIAGDATDVRCVTPNDADPAHWQPGQGDITDLQQAAVILVNGASFESWVATAPIPRSRVVDTTAAFRNQYLSYETKATHSHGPGGAHSHEGVDGHTWLDPVLAIRQAEAVRDGLVRAFPDRESSFAAGFAALAADLRGLDASLREMQALMSSVTIVASHPAYNYLAQQYDWNLINQDIPPDELVDDQTLTALAASLPAGEGPMVVLWESSPLEENRVTMQERFSARSVIFEPCEAETESETYITRMQQNIERLREACSGG